MVNMVYMPHWPKELGYKPGGFSLSGITSLLDRLGNPNKKLNAPIHVTGTNGKGSTVSFLRYILESAGYSVNVYTSPHLIDFNERIVFSGKKISDDFLYEMLEECRLASEGLEISFFEGTTAAAFLAFAAAPADFNIIEVGMGGRLDATNVLNPILSVITSVDIDHSEYLGPAVEIIAEEKAGIMKKGVPVVIGSQKPTVMKVLENHATREGSSVFRRGFEWDIDLSGDKILFQDKMSSCDYELPFSEKLSGRHQASNIANAVASCILLSSAFGYDMCLEDFEEGIKKAEWPARLEHIKKGKIVDLLPNSCELYLDGCHNVNGANAITNWISDLSDTDFYGVIGLTRGKDILGFLNIFKPFLQYTAFVCVKSEYRAEDATILQGYADKINILNVKSESLYDAVSFLSGLIRAKGSRKSVILICGSLFLARDLFFENI